MSGFLKSHMSGSTMVLSIHHPANRNSLDRDICVAAVEAINSADSNPEIHTLVITGAGPDFSGGSLLHPAAGQAPLSASSQAEGLESLHNWIEVIHSFSKPVVAAVEGVCNDTGFALALACDFVVAARDSTFGLGQVAHGQSPEGGITWSLARALPRATVMQWLMLGEPVAAQRLADLGIVNHLSDNGHALEAALALCQRLNRLPAKTLRSVKELANDAMDHSLNAHLKLERDHVLRQQHMHWRATGDSVH